jgi:hypothetical protein
MDDRLLEDESGDEPRDDEAREDEITGRAEVERGEDKLTRVEDEPTVAREVERMEPVDSAKVKRSVLDGGAGRTSPAVAEDEREESRPPATRGGGVRQQPGR